MGILSMNPTGVSHDAPEVSVHWPHSKNKGVCLRRESHRQGRNP
jgi:hypothetical protein